MYEPLDPAAWREFYFTIAAASAALIGLIVVGLSIHADLAVSIVARAGEGGGLYWIALETIGALVWAIAGAWRFLIGVADERRT